MQAQNELSANEVTEDQIGAALLSAWENVAYCD